MNFSITVNGILSPNSDENPYWHGNRYHYGNGIQIDINVILLSDANHVYLPYCSSDSWSGDAPARSAGDLAFLGSRIIEQTLVELLPRGLLEARLLVLAGSSAGAAGVLVNLDRVAELMASVGSKVCNLVQCWWQDQEGWSSKRIIQRDRSKGSFGDRPKRSFKIV